MKKVLSLVLALVLVFGLSIAAMAEDDASFVITVTANPTTGYDWVYVLSEDGIVTVEQEVLTSEDIDKIAGIEPAGEMMAGEGCFYIYTIKGVKPGNVMIALEYNRSWEEDSSVAGLTYMLKVNEDLSVVAVGSTLGI